MADTYDEFSSLPLGEIFSRVARENPDRIAVQGEDSKLTYAELEENSGRLARYLRSAGAGPGGVVAVDPIRRPETIIALLGVIKSGAAYVALERRHPPALQAEIIADAGVRILLTYRDGSSVGAPELTVIRLDEPWPDLPACAVALTPGHAAYIAYTSGSTGRPKGVCVPHRAVSRLVIGADFLPISPDDVFLQFSSIAFDASTLEIWGPLLNGARLTLAPARDMTARQIARYVLEHEVTVLWLTAGLFQQMVDTGLSELRKVRYLLAGGDVLSVLHVRRALALLPDTVLINGYGPTENTTFTCCHRIAEPVGASVPIGRPIRGTSVRVLNQYFEPVPDGEVGELYAAGAGLSRGYLGDPALTAEKFLPDPFADRPGQTMYRTGDLVRRAPDGVLEFCGRIDQQVKIRGFRVEPSAVELALMEMPEIAEAAVVAQSEPGGGRRLVAFVVAANSGQPSPLCLRARLHEALPSYAVPALIRPVNELPLTANGKVDRARLVSDHVGARPELAAAFREPATSLENTVTTLWRDHLGISPVGADDDFFELGGHSMLCVWIINDLSREFGVEISPVDFYLTPTPAGLAATIKIARESYEQA